MDYYTYWTINDAPSNATQPYSIFLWMLIISIIAFLLIYKFKKEDGDKKFYLYTCVAFMILSVPAFIYLKFFGGNPNQERLDKYLSDKKLYQVEGLISNYERVVPYARNGKQPFEQFYVDTVKFNYLDNTLYEFSNFGGNHTRTFRDGLPVRISYVISKNKKEIQKIEIGK